jgi:hypothetical protein
MWYDTNISTIKTDRGTKKTSHPKEVKRMPMSIKTATIAVMTQRKQDIEIIKDKKFVLMARFATSHKPQGWHPEWRPGKRSWLRKQHFLLKGQQNRRQR